MCDQTEVTYSPGDVVWVKLSHVWWPGQVYDYEKLPEEITVNLRKKPIAVVKFFQEETFEYVKNLNVIYHYNSRKKEEFIKKGLDLMRSSNSRDVPSNMKMFPNDVVMAEHLTGGDPNILDTDTFAPEQKSDYKDLFGSAKKLSGKKAKFESLKKEKGIWKTKKFSVSPLRSDRRSLSAQSATIPRPITHPRFIAKALEGRSDHEIRIRCQASPSSYDDKPVVKHYNCYLCDFHTTRLNVMVYHNKTHSPGFIEARNAIKARSRTKDKERYSVASFTINEKTPATVTSRGRVKSLPKKLMDFSEEPPAKMLKEKVSSATNKQISKENNSEKSPSKSSPKKSNDFNERKAIKRPLFGKRKTAKEKAEMAAKIKLENDAMKETLLKDWDDDDVNEEEVELERLKQALDSTTTSAEDTPNTSVDEIMAAEAPVKPASKLTEKVYSCENKPAENKNDNKSKVFEFDDSEDSLPLTNFRLKNQREKFTDDKFKKPKPPKPLVRASPKPKTTPISPLPLPKKVQEEEDKEAAKFNEAFNALLEETELSALPEIPKISLLANKPEKVEENSDQTSDISSSTDLLDVTNNSESLTQQAKVDVINSTQISDLVNNDLRMECTSSDNEEVITTDYIEDETAIIDNQKNFDGISASDPSTEIEVDLMAGVASTSTNELVCETVTEDCMQIQISEDSTTPEISSTCDVKKPVVEESNVNSDLETHLSNETSNALTSSVSTHESLNSHDTNTNLLISDEDPVVTNVVDASEERHIEDAPAEVVQEENNLPKPEKLDHYDDIKDVKSESEPIKDVKCESETIKKVNSESEQIKDVKSESEQIKKESVQKPKAQTFLTFSSDGNYEETEVSKPEIKTPEKKSGFVKEEIVEQVEQPVQGRAKIVNKRAQPKISTENLMSIQLIMPDGTECITTPIQVTSQQQAMEPIQTVPKLEISADQNMSQSLQDMELDINSMPVIIGGEDFIQPEQPKQNFVSIQPKYSESIVISPKKSSKASCSPKKPENLIMHLGEPSSSNQNLQSVIAIPSKGGKSRGSKTPKTSTKTIKLSASSLKNLGLPQKVGNQQVLILKTTSNRQSKEDGGTNQKCKVPLNMFQHGSKIILVNNPQISGQNVIKLNPQQQQLLSGGKLAPGTRVLTSKVVATTTSQGSGSGINQISTSRVMSKPTQKLVISKGSMLSNTSKGVIINNSSGKVLTTVPTTQTITTSKGQTLVTQNIVSTKGGLILPSSMHSASPTKTATIITSQALTMSPSKGMIISPMTSRGETIISGNQKLRIVSSKAPLKSTRLVVQNPQTKLAIDPQNKGQQVKFISGLKSHPGNTILIQTSQGIIAKSIASTTTSTSAPTHLIKKPGEVMKNVLTTVPTQTKIRVQKSPSVQQSQIVQSQLVQQSQQPKIVQQPKLVHHPDILQHTQILQTTPVVKKVQRPRQSQSQRAPRKSTPRAPKSAKNVAGLAPSTLSTPEQIMLSSSSSVSAVGQQTLVQGQIPQNSSEVLYLTLDESGNYRQVDKSMVSFEGASSEAPQTIFIPANNQIQDMGNLLIALDSAGNIVNLSQPASTPTTSFTTEGPTPGQDILAKALANTQVLQQETILPEMDGASALSSSMDSTVLSSSAYNDQSQYAPTLSHNVLETSLTLNQPIMTPLEVPSAVSPNLSSLPSNYISSNIMSSSQKNLPQSMPILSEEGLANQTQGEPVFLLDSSNNLIPATSGSQISFQLTLDNNNVIMTSGTGNVLPQSYQVVSSDLLPQQLVAAAETHSLPLVEGVPTSENRSFIITSNTQGELITPDLVEEEQQQSVILREALEAPQPIEKSEEPLVTEEILQDESLTENNSQENEFSSNVNGGKTEEQCEVIENYEFIEHQESTKTEDVNPLKVVEEVASHSLKRSLGQEEIVSSSSDLEDMSKRMRIDER